jgi:hypothetical protein
MNSGPGETFSVNLDTHIDDLFDDRIAHVDAMLVQSRSV